jgi:hypothetical protein
VTKNTPLSLIQIDGLSRSLGSAHVEWQLTVIDGNYGPDELTGDPVVRMTVAARPALDEPEQTWRVTLQLDSVDFLEDPNLEAQLVVVRANLEQWWETKDTKSPNRSIRATRTG